MLNVMELIGFGAGGDTRAPITITYVSSNTDAANASSYTYTAQSIGTAAANRYVVVVVGGTGNNEATISSVTLDGNTMTELVEATTGTGASNINTGIYFLAYPTGTTGDIVITFTAAKGRSLIGVYNINQDIVPNSVHTTTATTVSGDASLSLNTQSGGVSLACAVQASTATWTWTNLTEDFEATVESNGSFTGASANSNTGSTLAITADATDNVTIIAACAASWR